MLSPGDESTRHPSPAMMLADAVVACTALLAACTVPSGIEAFQALLLMGGYVVAAADAASRIVAALRPSPDSVAARMALEHLDTTVGVPVTVLASSPWPGLVRSSKTLDYGVVLQLVPLSLLVASSLLFPRRAALAPSSLLLSAALCCWAAWSLGGGAPAWQALACAAYFASDAALRVAPRSAAPPPLAAALHRGARALGVAWLAMATGTALSL